jgi:hypothetical protein
MRPPTLGSRARSSIPMTPRSVHGSGGIDFRRQIADLDGQPPTKKFKSSGPKGARLAAGYVDRSKQLRTQGEEVQDDKEKRLQALEEMYKLQQIDGETLEKLRRELGVGGNTETTHLVKGLDWGLLERVRRGEDVLKEPEKKEETEEEKVDVDYELDNALEHDVQATKKDDCTATHAENTSKPETEVLSRDEILRRLKASRSAAAMPPPPPAALLNDRFKKVGSDSKAEKKRFTEIVDGRRREVLLTTDKDGKSKRKTRWLDPPGTKFETPVQEVLGMEVPAEIAAKQKALLEQQKAEEDEDDDIFAGIGAEYDPLADIGSDEEDVDEKQAEAVSKITEAVQEKTDKPRNYFGTAVEEDTDRSNPISRDPTIMAALKRAAALRQAESTSTSTPDSNEDEELDPEKVLKRKAFLEKLKQQQRDDARDLDMGFGESRFGDEEDEDGPLYNSGDEKKVKRKRAPKKRKGDKDNLKDVMGVLEGRNKAK